MSIGVHGAANQGPAEVDVNPATLYTIIRPDDYQALGSYSLAVNLSVSPNDWNIQIANAPILAFQWTAAEMVGKLRKLTASIGSSTAGVAGTTSLQAFYARNYASQYLSAGWNNSVPTSVVLATNVIPAAGNKLRGSMGSSQQQGGASVGDQSQIAQFNTSANSYFGQIGSNIVLTARNQGSGTGQQGFLLTGLNASAQLTLDTQPFAAAISSSSATVGALALPPCTMFEAKAGEYPVIFEPYTGFVLQTSLPGLASNTIVYTISITITWDELPLSAYY